MRRVVVLGSTGSIGVSTLDVVASLGDRFRVVALAAGGNVERLVEQVRRHRPELVAVRDDDVAREVRSRVDGSIEVCAGPAGLERVAAAEADVVVSALVGALGLRPTWVAVELGRTVALANKEALVVAGRHMTRLARERGATILPVDSEHNALHQCLTGEAADAVRRLWLTASGGPFRGATAERLSRVTREEALAHPTWSMGPKITIDSATLMNKGLEVIEARWLFGTAPDDIRVVVHPQSIVHSMVEFVDGSFKAQLGVTDMRHPIRYALTWPERLPSDMPPFDPVAAGRLDFEAPDVERFPCLRLAYDALRTGGAAPAVLNAANEVAVAAFLDGRAAFLDIPATIERALERHGDAAAPDLDGLLAADAAARRTAAEWLAAEARR